MVAGQRPVVSSEAKLNAVIYACQQMAISIFDGVAVRGKKDQLWVVATQFLDGRISPSTLALDFASNVHNLRDEFTRIYTGDEETPEASSRTLQSSPLPEPEPDNHDGDEDLEGDLSFPDDGVEDDSEFQSASAKETSAPASRESGKLKEGINEEFEVNIDSKTWQTIQPYKKDRTAGNGSYWCLQSDYRCALLIAIWRQTKIPCCLSIRRHNVRTTNDKKNFIEVQGYCSDDKCRVTFEATIAEEILRDDGSIIFKLSVRGRKNIKHRGAQQFRRQVRSEYKKILFHKSAAQVDELLTRGSSCFHFHKYF